MLELPNDLFFRKAFQTNAIIYVPARACTENEAAESWRSSEDVFWDGPPSVFSKTILTPIDLYDHLRKFFTSQLRIESCPQEFLLKELRVVEKYGGRPLTPAEHQRVFDLLIDVSDAIQTYEKMKKPIQSVPWLKELRTLSVFPAVVAADDVRLHQVHQVYNPIGGEDLSKLFSGRVPLLVSPRYSSLGHLRALLASDICADMKLLRYAVHKDIRHTVHVGTPLVDVPLSKQYSSRLEALQR